MKWGQDKLVDRLIANNAARPRPGMDKPDAAMLTLPGKAPKLDQPVKRDTPPESVP